MWLNSRCNYYTECCLLNIIVLDKPKEEKKDTFLEKLATQVIKNVQVKITGIHVKYEDDVSIRNIFSSF